MLNKADLISTRDFIEADTNFILATWLKGLRYGNSYFKSIESKAYFFNYEKLIKSLLETPKTIIKIACLKDDPGVILGYSVSEPGRLHFVFVKKAWRTIGIGKSLVSQDLKVISHITDMGRNILQKYPEVTLNPFNLLGD